MKKDCPCNAALFGRRLRKIRSKAASSCAEEIFPSALKVYGDNKKRTLAMPFIPIGLQLDSALPRRDNAFILQCMKWNHSGGVFCIYPVRYIDFSSKTFCNLSLHGGEDRRECKESASQYSIVLFLCLPIYALVVRGAPFWNVLFPYGHCP